MLTHYLRRWREERGLTQEALAAKTATFASVISRLETGNRAISLEMAVRLCRALDIGLADLLRAPENNQSEPLVIDARGFRPEKLADFTRTVEALAKLYREG